MMTIKKIIDKIFSDNGKISTNESNKTDTFADTLSLDFKRAASEVILEQLKKVEGKYLSTILKQSYFPIISIIFYPNDEKTALETEEFFRVHSQINPNFEKEFFSSILLKEYRTELGARGVVEPTVFPVIQPNTAAADNPTDDELYQITLRGNKKRFGAIIELGALKEKKDEKNSETYEFTSPAKTSNPSQIAASNLSSISVSVFAKDASGEISLNIKPPFIIGRKSTDENSLKKIDIGSMYISRHQLCIFELNQHIYFFIPDEAKLLAVRDESFIIKKMSLIEITNRDISLVIGQPDNTQEIIVDSKKANLFPTIKLSIKNTMNSNLDKTPIPNIDND